MCPRDPREVLNESCGYYAQVHPGKTCLNGIRQISQVTDDCSNRPGKTKRGKGPFLKWVLYVFKHAAVLTLHNEDIILIFKGPFIVDNHLSA